MLYILAVFSIFVMLGMVTGIILLLTKHRQLGYLKVFLITAIFLCSSCLPLFYGNVGYFFQWPYAEVFYHYIWLGFIIGPILCLKKARQNRSVPVLPAIAPIYTGMRIFCPG